MVEPPTCDGGTCELFGLFGIFVQGLIGAWCLFTLIVLWRCESPPRPFLTWVGDMSKQLVGACWGHFMNVFIAIFFGKALESTAAENQCVWYLVGFLSDIIFVTFLCWWVTSTLRPCIRHRLGIDIGDYETPPATVVHADDEVGEEKPVEEVSPGSDKGALPPWLLWAMQTGIWLAVMTAVKVFVSIGVFIAQGVLYSGVALTFRHFGLCGRQNAQLITSVIIIPVIGDAFQFAVQDGFLKKEPGHAHKKMSLVGYEAATEQR